MATGKSGSFAVTTSNQFISGIVEWSETYDIESNTSQVTATLRLSRTNTGFETYGSGNFTISIGGNGKTESGAYSLTYLSNTQCVSHTAAIPHDADGSKSIVISVSGVIYAGSPNMYLNEQSGNVVLTTIPRASTLTAPNGEIGGKIKLSVKRASNSFTHTIKWSAGGKNGTFNNVGDSVEWSIDDYEIARGNTKGATVPCSFTVTTYQNGKQIGTAQTASCVLTIPQNEQTLPQITLSDITAGGDETVLNWGVYLKGKSTAGISIADKVTMLGASVKSVQITFSGGGSTTEDSLTANCEKEGVHRFTATLTDTRGFSVTAVSEEITVLDYSAPVITDGFAVRCLQDGEESTSGTFLLARASYGFSQVGQNSIAAAKVLYRESGGGAFIEAGDFLPDEVQVYRVSAQVEDDGGFQQNQGYDIVFEVADSLGSTDTLTVHLSTAECILNINNKGNGMGIGKYAQEENLLDVAWDVRTSGDFSAEGKFHAGERLESDGPAKFWNNFSADGDGEVWGGFTVGGKVKLYSALTVENGGTGATTGAAALQNLGAADYVVETGTKDGWTYRKWQSGLAECWKRGLSVTVTTDYVWGGGYLSSNVGGTATAALSMSLPAGLFVTPLQSNIDLYRGGYVQMAIPSSLSTTEIGFYVWSPTKSDANRTLYASASCIGYWK